MLVISNKHFRGIEQIRTAVDAFAEHSLATRPRYRFERRKFNYFKTISTLIKQIIFH